MSKRSLPRVNPAFGKCCLLLPDGSQRHFEVHSYPVKDVDGEVIQAFEHSQDITERRNLELQLKTSEEKYRTIVETAREGIFILDYKARITFANKCLAHMLGYNPEEFLGRTLCSLMDEEARARGRAQFDQSRQGQSLARELRLTRQNGLPLHCLVSITPLMVGNNFYGSIGRRPDISQLKQSRTELRTAKILAAQALGVAENPTPIGDPAQIARQVHTKSSLAEIFNFMQDITLKIFSAADPIFLILDANKNALVPCKYCPSKIYAPLARLLMHLEKSQATSEFFAPSRENQAQRDRL